MNLAWLADGCRGVGNHCRCRSIGEERIGDNLLRVFRVLLMDAAQFNRPYQNNRSCVGFCYRLSHSQTVYHRMASHKPDVRSLSRQVQAKRLKQSMIEPGSTESSAGDGNQMRDRRCFNSSTLNRSLAGFCEQRSSVRRVDFHAFGRRGAKGCSRCRGLVKGLPRVGIVSRSAQQDARSTQNTGLEVQFWKDLIPALGQA